MTSSILWLSQKAYSDRYGGKNGTAQIPNLYELCYGYNDVEKNVKALIEQDDRISFIGWKNGDELLDYLCACDMYLQPGTQSVTLQNAICCGCPIMIFPYKSHEVFIKNNGFFVRTVDTMTDIFLRIGKNPAILEKTRAASYEIAYNILDYRKLAARLYM